MTDHAVLKRRDELTFRGNIRRARYGWLRLTPAYSVESVSALLSSHATNESLVLDPLCGTGTTALLCAERGIGSVTTDINPFLVWLASTKARPYLSEDIDSLVAIASQIQRVMVSPSSEFINPPPIHQIEKWWSSETLKILCRIMAQIQSVERTDCSKAADLLKLAFCQVMIKSSNASFNHQSMSFKRNGDVPVMLSEHQGDVLRRLWSEAVGYLAQSAASPIALEPTVLLKDARDLTAALGPESIDCVITSPPYPNRMSYVRELRPYMYWLGFLGEAREAGELDWQAIGGTWGCATSNVAKWVPDPTVTIPFDSFHETLAQVARRSDVLSRYIHKYFTDMSYHVASIASVVKPGGSVHYIVGNSKFFDVMLPVERLYADLFQFVGFEDVQIDTIRKRTSKKELFEFVVSAYRPGGQRSESPPSRREIATQMSFL